MTSQQFSRLIGMLACLVILPVHAQVLVVANDFYGIRFGKPLQVEPLGVLENDTLDGEQAGENGAIAELISGPANGVLQCPSDDGLALCPDGSFDYTPGVGFEGRDSFIYRAVAGGLTGTATVTLTACSGGPDIYSCWLEPAYLELLSELGYGHFREGFEGSAWDSARTPVTAPSVTSQGILWTTNFPDTNNITTGSGAARTGHYSGYDRNHGLATGSAALCDIDNPPEDCLYHDGLSGQRLPGQANLHGVGGYITGMHGNNMSIFLDDTTEIGFGQLPGNQYQFIGVIDNSAAGFRSFEFREMDGKVGQAFLIWGDDYIFASSSSTANTAPLADAGPPQSVLVGASVVLDGSASSDFDKDPLSYLWSFVSKPAASTASLDTTDPIHPGFLADQAGSYMLRLIVNDSTVDSVPDTVEITVGCSGQVLSISNTTLPLGVTVCVATSSIVIGPNVLVPMGAELWLDAPVIIFKTNVTVEPGATLLAVPVP